jgi:hypothetical protein
MTTQAPQLVSMQAEDLYRLGNATSPKLHNPRADDVNTYERNGIAMVVANGKGISLITEARLRRIEKVATGYVWKLPANLPMPPAGLALNPDMDSILKPGGLPEHYFLCPISDMTLSEYVGLLSKLALKLERTRKL